MSEFSIRASHATPTCFSDDTVTPFEDIGMTGWDDAQIVEFFRGKTVLDVGSGFEGIARGLYATFNGSEDSPKVINLNPQFTDWRMNDRYENGQRTSERLYKYKELQARIEDSFYGTGFTSCGYFAGRAAVAGLVQQLPFSDGSIDIVTSTWGFPTSFYDSGNFGDKDFVAGFAEIQRILRPGSGIALLAPLRLPEFRHTKAMLDQARVDDCEIDFRSTGERWGSQEYVLELRKS